MPSREEGFGLVALETLEANRPIVASERSGFATWLLREIDSRAPHLRQAAADCVFAIPDRRREDDDHAMLSGLADSLARSLRRLLIDYPGCLENVRMLREVLMPLDWSCRASEFVASLPAPSRAAALTTMRGAEGL
jgi:glycosyltransferase involved in cell wall biosynthesis